MSEQEPGAKHRLRQDVEDRVGDNLRIDRQVTSPITNTPDASLCVSMVKVEIEDKPMRLHSHRIRSPDDQREEGNGVVEG
jgi:hypothetical protein